MFLISMTSFLLHLLVLLCTHVYTLVTFCSEGTQKVIKDVQEVKSIKIRRSEEKKDGHNLVLLICSSDLESEGLLELMEVMQF